jgi:hypothetical protein
VIKSGIAPLKGLLERRILPTPANPIMRVMPVEPLFLFVATSPFGWLMSDN